MSFGDLMTEHDDSFEPLTWKDWVMIGGVILLITLLAVGLVYYRPPDAGHDMLDTGTVVQDNTYLGNNHVAFGQATVVYGDLVIHDNRNGLNYTFTPGCQYWKLGSTMTFHVVWFDDNWAGQFESLGDGPFHEQDAHPYLDSAPSGCLRGINGQ